MAYIKIYNAAGIGLHLANQGTLWGYGGLKTTEDDYEFDGGYYSQYVSVDGPNANFTYGLIDWDYSDTPTYQMMSVLISNSSIEAMLYLNDPDGGNVVDRDYVWNGTVLHRWDVEGDDVIIGNRYNDYIDADRGDDDVAGYGGNDTLLGGAGNDDLSGGKGKDRLDGGAGRDKLLGGNSSDVLMGGKGNDTLKGGDGVDKFVFRTGWDVDTIKDFDATGSVHDRIDLSGLNSVKSWTDLKNNHLEKDGSDVVIDGRNGDRIVLEDVTLQSLDKGDFIF